MRTTVLVLMALAVAASGCMHVAQTQPEPDKSPSTDSTQDTSQETQNHQEENIVRYTSNGFQPQTITIQQGETVTWVNENGPMWVASDKHPTHEDYDGTFLNTHCQNGEATGGAFDQCSTGDQYSFTFEKTGTWRYHNHRAAGDTGTVKVE